MHGSLSASHLRRFRREPNQATKKQMFKVGDYVRHVNCPEWGIGQIADIRGSMLVVHFEHSDRAREFRDNTTLLVAAPEAEANPPRLTHLKLPRRSSSGKRPSTPKVTRTFEEMLASFPEVVKEGFAGEAWRELQKARAQVQAALQEHLPKKTWTDLCAAKDLDTLGQHHRTVVQTAKLLHPVQALRISKIRTEGFWEAYRDLVFDAELAPAAFETMLKALEEAGQAAWPNITALRSVVHPKTDLHVKPDSAKRMAASIRFELAYDTKPSLDGYRRLLDFATEVRSRLEKAGHPVADFWDVSQFVRSVASTSPVRKKKAPADGTASTKPAPEAAPPSTPGGDETPPQSSKAVGS